MEIENKVDETGLNSPATKQPETTPTHTTLPSDENIKEAGQAAINAPAETEAGETLSSKGLDLSTFEKEYAEKGELTEESYKLLEKSGINRATVENYIAGQQALFNGTVADIKSSVGGEATFDQVISWAADNLSTQEKEAYNKVVAGNDNAAIKLALSGIYAKYKSASGYPPSKTLTGTETVAARGYSSMAEMVRDVQDPRYRADEAYRRRVTDKASRSNMI